ncbi:hypothetical protein DO70_4474 [Burkholderia pseudomallei]|nr:hypothetical protein DO70_4474 [Burkholderia pseudomallei]
MLVRVALRAAVAADEKGVEIVDPFPDQPVQVAQAIDVRRAADARQHARRRLLVPRQDLSAPQRIVARVGARRVGGGRILPFEPRRQPRAFARAIRARGEPAHARDGRVGRRRRSRMQRVGPVGEIRGAGEHVRDAVAPPFGMRAQKPGERAHRHRRVLQFECIDVNGRGSARHVLRQRALEVAAGQPHEARGVRARRGECERQRDDRDAGEPHGARRTARMAE